MTATECLRKAATFSNHLNFRDKSIKILQYSMRMLHGYYGKNMSDAMENTVATVTLNCSQGRKAFRLLKSVNMIYSLTGLLSTLGNEEENSHAQSEVNESFEDEEIQLKKQKYRRIAKRCEALELACMIGYYACDNVLFLGRAKILSTQSYNARFWEKATFSFWAANDMLCLYRTCMALWLNHQELRKLEQGQRERKRISNGSGNSSSTNSILIDNNSTVEDISPDSIDVQEQQAQVEEDALILSLCTQRNLLVRNIIKSLFDLGISGGHCMNCFENSSLVQFIDRFTPLYKLFGHNAQKNGLVGICGVMSSAMIIQDIMRK